jgi:hypothetical protein
MLMSSIWRFSSHKHIHNCGKRDAEIFVQKTSREDSNLETQKQVDLREIVYGVYWFMIEWGASVKTMDLISHLITITHKK